MTTTESSNAEQSSIGWFNHTVTSWNAQNDNAFLSNMTSQSGCSGTVHDIRLEKTFRLLILFLTIGLCIIGSFLVVLWMLCNRRISSKFNHLSRVNSFILNLTSADILVILLAVLPQLVWEYVDREWVAGDFMCRAVKFLQTFSMTSSNYMLVVIAIDRHQAVRAPLKESLSVWKMAGTGWLVSAIISLPVAGVFHTSTSEDGKTMCENIFRNKPMWHRQIWVTWAGVSVFFVPLVVLVICYTRIFLKISQKALQTNNLRYKPTKGKVLLQSNNVSTLPKAKVKTLKMTFVIIVTFIVCSTPYFFVEMIMSFGDHCIISRRLYAILGGMAACNSATNPYVFLAFNINPSWIREVMHRARRHDDSPLRYNSYRSGQTSGHTGHYTAVFKEQHILRQETLDTNIELRDIHS